MTNVRSLVALAVVAAFASAASAQPVPAARTDVKADATAAAKSGKTAEGEIKDGSASAPTGMSDKSRSDVKSEATAANKAGATAQGEKGSTGSGYGGPTAKTGSTASRTDVKNEARAANKAGTTAEGEIGKQEGAPGSARVTPAAPATR